MIYWAKKYFFFFLAYNISNFYDTLQIHITLVTLVIPQTYFNLH